MLRNNEELSHEIASKDSSKPLSHEIAIKDSSKQMRNEELSHEIAMKKSCQELNEHKVTMMTTVKDIWGLLLIYQAKLNENRDIELLESLLNEPIGFSISKRTQETKYNKWLNLYYPQFLNEYFNGCSLETITAIHQKMRGCCVGLIFFGSCVNTTTQAQLLIDDDHFIGVPKKEKYVWRQYKFFLFNEDDWISVSGNNSYAAIQCSVRKKIEEVYRKTSWKDSQQAKINLITKYKNVLVATKTTKSSNGVKIKYHPTKRKMIVPQKKLSQTIPCKKQKTSSYEMAKHISCQISEIAESINQCLNAEDVSVDCIQTSKNILKSHDFNIEQIFLDHNNFKKLIYGVVYNNSVKSDVTAKIFRKLVHLQHLCAHESRKCEVKYNVNPAYAQSAFLNNALALMSKLNFGFNDYIEQGFESFIVVTIPKWTLINIIMSNCHLLILPPNHINTLVSSNQNIFVRIDENSTKLTEQNINNCVQDSYNHHNLDETENLKKKIKDPIKFLYDLLNKHTNHIIGTFTLGDQFTQSNEFNLKYFVTPNMLTTLLKHKQNFLQNQRAFQYHKTFGIKEIAIFPHGNTLYWNNHNNHNYNGFSIVQLKPLQNKKHISVLFLFDKYAKSLQYKLETVKFANQSCDYSFFNQYSIPYKDLDYSYDNEYYSQSQSQSQNYDYDYYSQSQSQSQNYLQSSKNNNNVLIINNVQHSLATPRRTRDYIDLSKEVSPISERNAIIKKKKKKPKKSRPSRFPKVS